jgi:hypothetical protein
MATRLEDAAGSEASSLAQERFREALEGHRVGYPRGAIFVPSDTPYANRTLLRALRDGQPAVVVFPDGQERVVRAERPSVGRLGMRARLAGLRDRLAAAF